jgi:hypothetical protein
MVSKLNTGYGNGTQINNDHAYQEALKNGWDIVIPQEHELQLDIDSPEQYQAYQRAKITFERNIKSITDIDERPSKSGLPGKYHIYIEIDMASGNTLHWSGRIAYQLMLCSDPVREMLSYARGLAGEKYPTLFFELPGKKPGMGKILPNPLAQSSTTPAAPPAPPLATVGQIMKSFALPIAQPAKSVILPQISADPPDDPSRYPHTCGKCGGPAYVGLFKTDCKNGCK